MNIDILVQKREKWKGKSNWSLIPVQVGKVWGKVAINIRKNMRKLHNFHLNT